MSADQRPERGTKVTCLDADGNTQSVVIVDDFVLIVDGNRMLDSTRRYDNGTVVLTVKRRPA